MTCTRSTSLFVSSLAIACTFGLAHGRRPGLAQDLGASKTAKFATVSAKSADVRKALDAKNLAAGLKLAGKKGSFVGTVVSVYTPRNHAGVYLDFSQPYKNSISGQILAANLAKFPSLSVLSGKRVLITGKFFVYERTHPEVAIDELTDIKLVK
jgi:hypothetical protein